MKEKIKRFFKYLYIIVRKPEMEVLPGQLAFFFMMMLIPLFTLLGSLLSLIDFIPTTINDSLHSNLPQNIADIIVNLTEQPTSSLSIWIILIPTLILASNATYSIIVTSNSIYKVKNSNYIKNRIKAFIMMIVLVFLFIFLMIIPTFSAKLFDIIESIFKISILTTNQYAIFRILRFPVLFLLVFISIKILYKIAPNTKIKSKSVTYGAFFSSILIIVSTWLYSFYIDYFSTYEDYYGNLSNLLVLMLWLYIISYIFVLGIALNATRNSINHEDTIIEKKQKELEKNK